jgi:uncharacterized protein with PIN domain
MSARSDEAVGETRFIVDRMLGTLSRYLRFMGYDTISANSLREGNTREDTILLRKAVEDHRILLTKDKELARRGGEIAVLIQTDEVLAQIDQLAKKELILPDVRMTRCSLCNELLRPAGRGEVEASPYAPRKKEGLTFFWCRHCRQLYWMGSHGRDLKKRLKERL